MTPYHENGDFVAALEHVVYEPSLDAEPSRPFPFAYFIRLENNGSQPLRVQGRKWIVTGASGRVDVVEGEGVIGQLPVIDPGTSFRYNSYLTLAENSTVVGSFFARRADGILVAARLPQFYITLPHSGADT